MRSSRRTFLTEVAGHSLHPGVQCAAWDGDIFEVSRIGICADLSMSESSKVVGSALSKVVGSALSKCQCYVHGIKGLGCLVRCCPINIPTFPQRRQVGPHKAGLHQPGPWLAGSVCRHPGRLGYRRKQIPAFCACWADFRSIAGTTLYECFHPIGIYPSSHCLACSLTIAVRRSEPRCRRHEATSIPCRRRRAPRYDSMLRPVMYPSSHSVSHFTLVTKLTRSANFGPCRSNL
ncbi:hypothetical protein GQ53DRAFT_14139 [Thozetella sp. PMI_491]|nr:hypothetical protein GQ53DRAFT_14139 [Thozetella sp. PMI_491]